MSEFKKLFKELEDLTGSSNTSCKKFTSLSIFLAGLRPRPLGRKERPAIIRASDYCFIGRGLGRGCRPLPNLWLHPNGMFPYCLKDLGFQIESCGSAGHKIARHPAIDLALYPNFNCGHNQGAVVKRGYINTLYKFVTQHEEAIKEHLK